MSLPLSVAARKRALGYGKVAAGYVATMGRFAMTANAQGVTNGVRALSALGREVWSALRGDPGRCICPLCGWTGPEFGPVYYVDHYREGSRCWGCGAVDRSRAAKLLLEGPLAGFFRAGPRRVLDIAPLAFTRDLFPRTVEYVSFDLLSPLADVRGDIQEMPFSDASFDFWMCFHVLDLVPDDGAAMRELFRVLRPGGMGLLDNAMSWDAPTVEYGKPRNDECGHIRRYGSDLPDKLRAVGFEVELLDVEEAFDLETRERFGVAPRRLVLCKRP